MKLGLPENAEAFVTARRFHPDDYRDFDRDAPPLGGEDHLPPRPPVTATPYVWTDPEAIPLREWLYGRHLIRKFVSATIAPGGVGKSSLVLAETLAMASGKDLLGVHPSAALRIWLWNLEDPREEIARRIQATAKRYQMTAGDIAGRLFVDSGREQSLIIAESTRGGAVLVRPVVDSIVSEISKRRIDILIVDPFVSCHEVGENDNTAMDMIAKEWGRVADRANCAVELVHHTRKTTGTDSEVTTESSRGGKALTDACRSVRVVNRMTKEEGDRAGVENHRLHFRTYSDKLNLAPPPEKSDWFKIVSVDLGNGDGGSGDSIGVVTKWEWPDPTADITARDVLAVQRAIDGQNYRHNVQAADWVGHAIAETLKLDVGVASEKETVKAAIKMWLGSGALVTDTVKDEKGNRRPIVRVG